MEAGVLPSVSVIVPVYNAERYLRRSLDSALAQRGVELEIICVNDGSTDGSGGILSEYAARDARVRVVEQANGGQGLARNRGLDLASRPYVYFLDADDSLATSGALAACLAAMIRDRLDMILFDAETVFDSGCEIGEVNPADYIRNGRYDGVWTGPDLFAALCRNRDYSVLPGLFVSRADFLRRAGIRFAEGVIHEDNVFMLKAMLSAERVAHRPVRAFVRYVHAGTTMTAPLSARNLRGYLASYSAANAALTEVAWPRNVRHAVAGRSTRYRLQIRKLVRSLNASDPDWSLKLSEPERAEVTRILRRNRALETLAAVRCCLQDRGLVYTLKRICRFGRNHG